MCLIIDPVFTDVMIEQRKHESFFGTVGRVCMTPVPERGGDTLKSRRRWRACCCGRSVRTTAALFQIHLSASSPPSNVCCVVTGSQRLSEEGQRSPDVEVHVRVPLEKEVPLTRVIEEPKPLEEKPEFPELTEVRTFCTTSSCMNLGTNVYI